MFRWSACPPFLFLCLSHSLSKGSYSGQRSRCWRKSWAAFPILSRSAFRQILLLCQSYSPLHLWLERGVFATQRCVLRRSFAGCSFLPNVQAKCFDRCSCPAASSCVGSRILRRSKMRVSEESCSFPVVSTVRARSFGKSSCSAVLALHFIECCNVKRSSSKDACFGGVAQLFQFLPPFKPCVSTGCLAQPLLLAAGSSVGVWSLRHSGMLIGKVAQIPQCRQLAADVITSSPWFREACERNGWA